MLSGQPGGPRMYPRSGYFLVCYYFGFYFLETVPKNDKIVDTRKYPLRGYILGSGAPGTPGVTHKTYGTTFISDIL